MVAAVKPQERGSVDQNLRCTPIHRYISIQDSQESQQQPQRQQPQQQQPWWSPDSLQLIPPPRPPKRRPRSPSPEPLCEVGGT
jgi:hypothetical protein